jgi:hypothetical protein
MTPRAGTALLFLVLLAATLAHAQGAYKGDKSKTIGNFRAGTRMIDSTTYGTFTYFDTSATALGELILLEAAHVNVNYAGFMRYGDRMLCDTTTATPGGFPVFGTMRLMTATAINANASTACTIAVRSDRDIIAKLVLGGARGNWIPSADSSGGWISPAARCVADSGDVITFEIVAAGGGAANPTRTLLHSYWREETLP